MRLTLQRKLQQKRKRKFDFLKQKAFDKQVDPCVRLKVSQ
jgi:hypothetical protein